MSPRSSTRWLSGYSPGSKPKADIKRHLVRGWLSRRDDDPAFFSKARAICDLYRNPSAGAVLLSIDEKTGIQARSRKHPTAVRRPGAASAASSNKSGTVVFCVDEKSQVQAYPGDDPGVRNGG